MRAFFAVDLPADIAAGIEALQRDLADADGLRLVDPSQAHLTLAFLGDVPDDGLPAVIEAGERAVADADVGPFELRVGGLGVFPSMEYVSVVWAGVTAGADELTALHDALVDRTTALGYPSPKHAFTPHVTLARMTDDRGKETVQAVVRDRDPEVGAFEVEEIRLKESRLTAEGPVYETVESFEV